MTHSPSSGGRIAGLDGLRAISILFVILTHVGFYNLLVERYGLTHEGLEPLSGGSGVQVFFVISGFLITTLLIREREQSGRISIRHFLIRRALRIFPTYYLFLLILGGLMLAARTRESYSGLALAATYTANFIPQSANTGELGHTWSLAVEEHFYLLWPLAFAWLRPTARAALLVAGVACCAWVRYQLGMGLWWGVDYYPARWTLPAADSIMIGCLAACWRSWRPATPASSSTWPWLQSLAGAVLFTAYVWMPAPGFFLVEMVKAFGIVMVLFAISANAGHFLTRTLEARPLRYIGVISYSLYIWQGLFLRTGPGSKAWFQQFPQNLILTLGAAALSYHFYEKPFLRLKNKFSRLRPTA